MFEFRSLVFSQKRLGRAIEQQNGRYLWKLALETGAAAPDEAAA